ncbi:MAG: hypothetical protein LBL21_03350 [Rickettsiales bacterium]|nr:hypothetical protein [Rickettsiales bacterium]
MKRQETRDKRQVGTCMFLRSAVKQPHPNLSLVSCLLSLPCLLFLVSCLLLSACGVKNNLEKPNRDFPRAYPVK